jgi:hypothetical protein
VSTNIESSANDDALDKEARMRHLAALGLMVIFMAGFAPPLTAQDVTGSWTLTYTMQGRQGQAMERNMDVTLKQEGDAITGTALMMTMGRPGGGGGGELMEVPISDGKVDEGKFTFSIIRGQGERSMTLVFSGAASGNEMEGTMAMSGGMRAGGDPVPFKGVRKEG